MCTVMAICGRSAVRERMEQALQATSSRGPDDWKIVEGRANRRFTDEEAVAEKVSASGFDPYTKKLRPLTEMEKLLGKKQFNDLLGDLVERPTGKPTLVSRTDPRPEMNNIMNDFSMEETNYGEKE